MSEPEWLCKAAKRAVDEAWTVGSLLHEYKALKNLNDEELCELLQCDRERLHLLALCRRPRKDHFAEDVARISSHLSIDAMQVAKLLSVDTSQQSRTNELITADVQETLDAVAALQLKVGAINVPRDRILVTLLPPPADPKKREQISRRLDDLVPELLTRYESAGALPSAYVLTRRGWLRTKHASRALDVMSAFLAAFRVHVSSESTTQRLEWPDLVAAGLTDADYHFACIIAKCFELQNGGSTQTWDGKHAPRASFVLPIDVDRLLDIVDPNDLVARREELPYARLHARKVITKEITGQVRRAIEVIYKHFCSTASWPLSRTLHVELAKDGISLEQLASGRFARGYDVHSEGARTMLTLAGLLIPATGENDRAHVVQVLRFIGDWAQKHPEDRSIDALTVMKRTGLVEAELIAVARMLLSQGSVYVTTSSDTFDVTKMMFYLSPDFIAHAGARDLWDIVLNEEEVHQRWHLKGFDGLVSAHDTAHERSGVNEVDDPVQQDESDAPVEFEEHIDIGILTIRDDEFRAVLNAFPEELAGGVHRGKFREYALRKGNAGGGRHYSLAIVRQLEQGNGEAQDAARDLLDDLEPSLLLVVGIAGGLPSDDLTLGDVVLSTRINDYSVEARKEGFEPTYAMSGGPIAKQIQAGISNLAAREKDLGDWAGSLPARPEVNWTREGRLYGPKEWQDELREKLESHYTASVARPPVFMAGPIASSDRLIKDPTVLFPWIQTARNLLAVEMESGGAYRAARDRCPMLAIRALSDIIGLKRSNGWTKFAAEAAAAFARGYLQTRPIPLGTGGSSPSRGIPRDTLGAPPPKAMNVLNISGGNVEARDIIVGEQHIHNDTTAAQLELLEKLVDNGLLDAATEQLDVLERSSWTSMTSTEKFRHRKLQGRVQVQHGHSAAGAARFVEAADFVPGDEKAQVLRVNALMLRNDLTGAHELASELVAQHPNLAAAKAAWITSAPLTARSDELLSTPWDGLDPQIASALADRLLSEDRAKEAVEVLQRAHSPGVRLGYWTTYSIALLKYQEQLGAEKGPSELLAQALPVLEKAYKLCVGDGLKEAKVQILLNMGYVHRLRNDPDEEWRVLREAQGFDPGHRDVRLRMAKILMERGRMDESIPMLEGLVADGPDYVPFLLGVALAKRNRVTDTERAADLFEQTARLAKPSQPALRSDGAEALVSVRRRMKQWDRALTACAEFVAVLGGFRSKELEANIHIDSGDSSAAHAVLSELTSSEMTQDQRRTLGVLFLNVGDNERAFGVLELVASQDAWTPSTAAVITAAQATGRDEFTIRICRKLRAAGSSLNSVVDAEATALFRRGQLAAAIEVVEHALSSQEDPFLRLRLSTLGIASNRPDLIEKDPSRLPNPGDGDPHVGVVTVGVLRAAGVHEVAIRYAYDVYRANRSNADGWRAIIEAFNPVSGPTSHEEPDVVAVDAAVLVREGTARRWLIVESRKPEAEHDEYSLDAPLVTAMLGKRVGESFELRRAAVPPRVYTIEEIRSKYVRAYQRCLDQWEEQFPDVPGPVMIEIPEDIEEFTKQLMPMLQERARRVEELDRLYRDHPVTLHMLARGLGGSVYGAIGHLIAETEIEIRCTRAGADEMHKLLAALEVGQKVILETSALSTILLLEEAEIVFEVLRGRIAIARSTVDELRVHRSEVEKRGAGSLGVQDGLVTVGELNEESRTKYLALIDVLLAKAAECEVFNEQDHDRLTPAHWDRLVDIGGAGAVESLHRALRTGELVWCDDMMLAAVSSERGVRVVWTQLMCQHLLLRSAITAERAHRISAKLVGWRFVKTNTTPGIYGEAARLATWDPDHWPLKQHLHLFEVEAWDDRSTGLLAVNTLREWWRLAPSDLTANAVTIALLDRISARPNGATLVQFISTVLEKTFGVDVLTYRRANAAVEAWRLARALRRGF